MLLTIIGLLIIILHRMTKWTMLVVLASCFQSDSPIVAAWIPTPPQPMLNGAYRHCVSVPRRRREPSKTRMYSKEEAWTEGSVNGERFTNSHVDDGFGNAICRVVALSDGKIPSSKSILPSSLFEPPFMLSKLDTIYHATAHAETSRLKYMERRPQVTEEEMSMMENQNTRISCGIEPLDEAEEEKVVSVLRNSLEDAGFELLSRRDLDLCEALNAGYLLRLSILEDTSKQDPEICREFYPERFFANGTQKSLNNGGGDEFLFDGRVLVFRRGYSTEMTEGRLLLPKLDYLQAGLVQRAAAAVTERLGQAERQIWSAVASGSDKIQQSVVRPFLANVLLTIPSTRVSSFLGEKWGLEEQVNGTNSSSITQSTTENKPERRENKVFKLTRYGGSKIRFVGSPNPSDALTPFLICEVNDGSSPASDEIKKRDVDHDIYENLNQGVFTCQYDSEQKQTERPAIQLLKRISISNIVDLFSKLGRSLLVKKFFEKSQLVEPTYEEVVVVWRNLPEKNQPPIPPKVVYDVAEIFAVDDRLPEKPPPGSDEPTPLPLEIRAFDDVPMANLPAVLPKTKLVFRPADAFRFDLISVLSLLVVLGSQKFDNPQLDLLAIVSVTLWVIRTFFRYSNKLARYDLLVNKFLTSKIAHRGAGALKYIATEAGSQRAARAALVHSWLVRRKAADSGSELTRSQAIKEGPVGTNDLLQCDRNVDIDIDAALNDLEDLNLVSFGRDGEQLVSVCEDDEVKIALKTTWNNVFEGNLDNLSSMNQRRIRPDLKP